MSGGFGAGFLKGLVVASIGAAVVSLAVPMPPVIPPATDTQVEVATPAGSGFNQGKADTNPVLPSTDQSMGASKEAGNSKPAPVEPEGAAPAPVKPLPAQPETQQSGNAMPAPASGADELAMVTPPAQAAPNPQAAVSPTVAPPALGLPMQPIENPVPVAPEAKAPAIETAQNDAAPKPDMAPEALATGQGHENAQMPAMTAPAAPAAPAEAMPAAKADNVPAAAPEAAAAPDDEVAQAPAQPAPVLPQVIQKPAMDAALLRNKVDFSNPANKPLFAVVLIDAGKEGLGREVLTTFSFPVTFGIDPTMPDAALDAKLFGDEGFEIMMMPPDYTNPEVTNAKPEDLAGHLADMEAKLPRSVGLIDRPAAMVQSDPAVAKAVIAQLKTQGLGLVTYDSGLNTTDKLAQQAGVKSGTVFRLLDGNHENGATIKRYLDRAELEAGQNGTVIVVGHTYSETVTALFSWAISRKAANVALSPVSAVLLAR